MAKDARSINLLLILITAMAMFAIVSVAAPRLAAAADVGITPEILAAAKKEGQVTYYTSGDLALSNKLAAAFEKKYGIKVNVVRMSSSTLFNRAVQEFEVGVNAADVLETSVLNHFVDLKAKQMLSPLTPASIGLFRSPAYYDPDHYWHAGKAEMNCIIYNKDLLKGDMVPKTWKDLTDPKYKDKVMQGHFKASGNAVVIAYNLVKIYGWQYYEGLRKNNVLTQQSCSNLDFIARGERPITMCDYSQTYTARLMNLPMIGGVLPQDGVFPMPGPTAVLAKAPHPNAAKVLANWILSPEGQTINVEGGNLTALDSPEVKYPSDYPDVKRLKLIDTDWSDFRKWREGGAEKFSDLFGG